MLDTLQIIFWSITYLLIIVAGFLSFREKKVSMPYVAGVLNFAWEICALYKTRVFWGHIAWHVLDLLIVCIGFMYAGSTRKRMLYAAAIIICTITLMPIFKTSSGMMYSVFVIDLLMAICFLIDFKNLSFRLKVPIAATKLLGDMLAGLHYSQESVLIGMIAVFVFICNMYYMYLCFVEQEALQRVQS